MGRIEEIEAELERRRIAEIEAELKRRDAPGVGMKGPVFGAVRSALNAITGQNKREFNYPDIGRVDTGLSFGEEGKVAAAKTFGNETDIAQRMMEVGVEVKMDAKGNPFIDTPDGPAYLNRPGLDLNDVLSFAGQAGLYAGGASLGNWLAKSTIGKALGTSGATAVTDIGAQKLAGREDIDPIQTLLATGIAGGTELAAPAVMGFYRYLKSTTDDQVALGREFAKRLGYTDDLTDDQAREFVKYADEIDAGATPEAIEAQRQGFQPTRGQKTGDLDQLSIEDTLESRRGIGAAAVNQAKATNRRVAENRLEEIQGQVGTGKAANAPEAAEQVGQALKREQSRLQALTDEAYKKVGNATIPRSEFSGFTEAVKSAPEMRTAARNPSLFRNTNAALKEMDAKIENLGSNVSVHELEKTRQVINDFIDGAKPQDERALLALKRRFDKWADGLKVRGDEEAINAYKAARAAHQLERSKFSPNDARDVGRKAAQAIAEGDLSARETVNMLFGERGAKQGAARVAKHMRETLGEASEGFKSMREMAFLRLVKNKTGDYYGNRQIISNLRSMTRGENKQLGQELFSSKQLDELGRFSNALEVVTKSGDFAKKTGSGERIIRAAADKARLGWIKDMFDGLAAVRPLSRPSAGASPELTGILVAEGAQ